MADEEYDSEKDNLKGPVMTREDLLKVQTDIGEEALTNLRHQLVFFH